MPNKLIEIHNLETQSLVQVVSPSSDRPRSTPPTSPGNAELRQVIFSHHGYLVPSADRAEKLQLVPAELFQPDVDTGTAPISHPPSKTVASRPRVGSTSFPRSTILVISNNSIHSLIPSTLISQAESLLESHRLQDVLDLADQHQRQLLGSSTIEGDQVSENTHRLREGYVKTPCQRPMNCAMSTSASVSNFCLKRFSKTRDVASFLAKRTRASSLVSILNSVATFFATAHRFPCTLEL